MNPLLSVIKKKYASNGNKKKKTIPNTVWTDPVQFIACGFGIGAIPFAPGTWGTLAAIPFYLILCQYPLWFYLVITTALNVIGIPLCGITNKAFQTTDHPAAVWDEIAAFMIVMITIPPTALNITLGFLLFRFFDIVKPGPVGWVDRNVHGGLGVMLDDIIAALCSWAILKVIIVFL